jgi:deoxyribodipyrimidine photo-lyase
LFIFDADILDKLPKDDARVSFIHENLTQINQQLIAVGASLWKNEILKRFQEWIWRQRSFFFKDYEPYAIARDEAICLLDENKIVSFFLKIKLFFEEKDYQADVLPYTVHTL